MAVSKFIQNIRYHIQEKSGLKINREQPTQPSLKWITEPQMSEMKAIRLRTAQQTKNGENLSLQQFNPSFFVTDGGKIHCRVPGCLATNERCESNQNKRVKQDLFLCPNHRATLKKKVSECCAKEKVIVDPARFKNEDFKGYTTLIGELEKAFTYLQSKWFMQSASGSFLADVFLNTRNFLMITIALLSLDEDNREMVFEPFLEIFRSFLKMANDPERMQNTLNNLKDLMNTLLRFFGVIYSWVVMANPGTRIGAGLGLVAGFVFGCAFPPASVAVSLMVGAIGGGLVGSGGYDWYKMKREATQKYYESISQWFGQQHQMHPNLINVPANASGDISIAISE